MRVRSSVPIWALCLSCVLSLPGFCTGDETVTDYNIQPVPFTAVHVNDQFWKKRLDTCREVTIPACFKKCEETRIPNFARAGGLEPGPFRGIYFDDSDVYKILEGAAYVLALQKDEKLDAYVDGVIAKIAAAQEEDGYLYSSRTIFQKYPQYTPLYMPPGGNERWSNTGGHELYCVGHMYEAAVAHFTATGKRNFLDIAIKNADFICQTFGPGKFQNWPPGHQEIEIGLVRLYRATGDKKYLDQAKYFLDIRGQQTQGQPNGRTYGIYGEYCQDHKPVVDQTEAVGHAVRAVYMYTGMADVAALTGDKSYVEAIHRIWKDVVERKLYITGGLGAIPRIEGFGKPYELPNDSAYCETCAAIAGVFWNQRLFLDTGDSKYIDVMERMLYNCVLSGVSMEGDSFFYPNVLDTKGGHVRSPWFGCSCCPSNISRLLPSMPGYMYAVRDGEVYVNLYAASEVTVPGVLSDGKPIDVRLKVETNYPWDGKVNITTLTPGKYTIKARLPHWAVGGFPCDDTPLYEEIGQMCAMSEIVTDGMKPDDNGYFTYTRTWEAGDSIELNFPMNIQMYTAKEEVEACRNKTAIQRGPLVYCLEQEDNPFRSFDAILLQSVSKMKAQFEPDLLNGVVVLTGPAYEVVQLPEEEKDSEAGENAAFNMDLREIEIKAIPYYAWSHRQHKQMSVWLACNPDGVVPLAPPTIASTSKVTASFVHPNVEGDAEFVNDGFLPKSSNDQGRRRWHWWSSSETKGKDQWIQYEFAKPQTVSKTSVYWFDDTGIGECRIPASWKLMYRDGQTWKPVTNPSGFGIAKDKFNTTTFDPVETTGLRIEIKSQPNMAGGIYEWTVNK